RPERAHIAATGQRRSRVGCAIRRARPPATPRNRTRMRARALRPQPSESPSSTTWRRLQRTSTVRAQEMTSTRAPRSAPAPERPGILAPVPAGQAGMLALGALIAIVILDQAPSATGALLATVVFSGSVIVAVAPIGSRTLEQWAPVAISFAIRSLRGVTRL